MIFKYLTNVIKADIEANNKVIFSENLLKWILKKCGGKGYPIKKSSNLSSTDLFPDDVDIGKAEVLPKLNNGWLMVRIHTIFDLFELKNPFLFPLFEGGVKASKGKQYADISELRGFILKDGESPLFKDSGIFREKEN